MRWLRGRPVWAGNRYDPGDNPGTELSLEARKSKWQQFTWRERGTGIQLIICARLLDNTTDTETPSVCGQRTSAAVERKCSSGFAF